MILGAAFGLLYKNTFNLDLDMVIITHILHLINN